MDTGRTAGNALAAFNVDTPVRDHSITEMTERQEEQEMGYVAEKTAEQAQHGDPGDDTETIT